MPFVTEELFITFYTPPYACPACDRWGWGNTTHIRAGQSQKVWVAKTLCKDCGDTHQWQVNPDIPMDEQGLRSNLHGGNAHIE